ncbi:MAG: SDR family oxidoreductase [Acidobacteriota bacterium]
MRAKKVLVTGATGYIGGRLVPRLLDQGYEVVCPVRSAPKVASRPWADSPAVEIVVADAADRSAMEAALRGVDLAYYLIHSMMAAGGAYARRDQELADAFAAAAAAAGCRRIVYLGGLGETGSDLSEHLGSRREVEAALASTGIPLTVLRAAMIIGSGSASFEILRYLVERLPVMVTPRWVQTECQPIGVRDVLHYLVACADIPETAGRTLDIGGPEILTYRQLMHLMSDARGLKRRVILPLPVLTPRLSSLWIHLVTPLSRHIARPLAEGLKNRVVCRNDLARRLIPHQPEPIAHAIAKALDAPRPHKSSWFDAGAIPGDPDWAGGTTFRDRRRLATAAPAERLFRSVCRIGGSNGWYGSSFLWRLRGWMDRLIGGPGLRRGRRDPEVLGFGDPVDFWRVTGIEANRRLELRAEMKLPGIATLEFLVHRRPDGGSDLEQTARFKPLGLAGLLYWYAVLPFHGIVFRGMMQGIRSHAEQKTPS